MKHTLLLPVILTGLLIAGCSTPPKRVDTGTIKARTFSFIDGGASPASAGADGREQVHRVIQDAITQNLAGKGLSKVASGGDVIAAYLVILGNNANTESISTYFGHGRDDWELHEKAQKAYNNSKNPNHFEAGTLLIDIIDSKTFEVLRRAYVVRPLLHNPSAEARAAHIQEAVGEVLKDLRIAQ